MDIHFCIETTIYVVTSFPDCIPVPLKILFRQIRLKIISLFHFYFHDSYICECLYVFILTFLGKRHNLLSVLSGYDPMTTVNCGFQSKKWAFRFANQSHLVSTKEFLNCVNHCVKLPRWFLGQRGGNFFFRNKI